MPIGVVYGITIITINFCLSHHITFFLVCLHCWLLVWLLGLIFTSFHAESLFNAFATAAFFKFVVFSIFEMRYLLAIWKASRPMNSGEGWEAMRRELSVLYSRFCKYYAFHPYSSYFECKLEIVWKNYFKDWLGEEDCYILETHCFTLKLCIWWIYSFKM